MKLSLRSWGGFTGPAGAVTRTVDLDALPEAERRRGRSLVDGARPFDQPEKILLRAPRPSDFNYRLKVEDGGRAHEIQLHLDAADPALRALVDWLEETAPPVGTTPEPASGHP